MPSPTTRSAADPLDDMDREMSGVDSAMSRQDRADLPGQRSDHPDAGRASDKYTDATRGVIKDSPDIDESVLDDHEASRTLADVDEPRRGVDDDDPIDETERAGDDALR